MLAGGAGGVFISKLLDPAPDENPWLQYVWFLMLFGLCATVVHFYGWSRRQIRVARAVGAWEPDAPPEHAIKTLQKDWSETIRTIWPGTAECAR